MNRFYQNTKKTNAKPSTSKANGKPSSMRTNSRPNKPESRSKRVALNKPKTLAPKLPRSLLASWEQFLIANGRFPKGTRKTEENNFKLIRKLILGEADSIYTLNESIGKGEQHRLESFLKTKKGLIAYLLSEHLDHLLNCYLLTERVGRKWRWKQVISQFPSFKITDWASGTGACAETWLDLLLRNKADEKQIQVNLLEQNPMLLEGSVQILNFMAPEAKVSGLKRPFDYKPTSANSQELSIHSLGFSWPYFKYNKKALTSFLDQLDHEVSEKKSSIISLIDRPTPESSRALMQLRDELINMGYQAVYPCPSGVAACPMLLEEKDWCYSEFDYEPTFIQKTFQRELRLDKPMAKSSAFLFASPKLLERSTPSIGTARVVGRPKQKTDSKSKKSVQRDFDYLMCTSKGLEKQPSSITQSKIARRGWDMHLPEQEIKNQKPQTRSHLKK
ncbi:MAG: hypothetical protein HRU09_15230 [Oligoflexales bacterium]|nr:hypothetical protein [Oligoflexales bacterium]